MKQTVRIIGGQYRGKKIHFPESEGLRPTPDRVRETLFNWLMHSIRNARCLDAFAGSGALGFEAFSRGAKRVVLVESAPKVHANLQQIARSFQSDTLSVLRADALKYLQETREQFDLVFLDPPFADNNLPTLIDLLTTSDLLVKGGLLYIESGHAPVLSETGWQQLKFKQAGQVYYGLYQKS
ncbi:MAG: 16S rRNA (guanine(966)-N(2))-methyltransferase RsmD [Tatlockia sp.]|jgi:16S rRNA (guanine966-N2)-methyltransferase